MKTSPFKVMTTAALSAAVAIPAATLTVSADEVEVQQVAFELDGEVQVVDFEDYVDAWVSESGELYEYVNAASTEAIGVGDGEFVSYEALVNAIIDSDEDMTGQEVLAEVAADAEAHVDEDTVAEYSQWGEDDSAPSVESAEAVNLKQVEVSFNNENFDAKEAKDVENYVIEDSDGNDVAVSEAVVDGDKVWLTLEGNVDNQTDATLTMDEAVTGDEVESDLSFFDQTPPEVTNAEVIGNDTAKVKFSEPLAVEQDDNGNWVTPEGDDVEDAFELEQDGDKLFIKSVDFVKNNTEANIEVYSTFEDGTVDLSIDKMLEDYASFSVLSQSFELDVEEDTDAPEVVDYKNATQQSVTLVFNEDIELADGVDHTDFYHTNSGNTVDEDISDDTGDQYGAEVDGNELTLTFNENELPSGTAYIYIDGESILDKWDNVNNSQIRQEVEVTVDEEAPEVEQVKANSESELEVKFSENVDADSLDADNFQLLNENGEEDDVIDDVELGDDADTVIVTLDSNRDGEYSLVIEGVEDVAGNEMDEVTETFMIEDSTAIDTDDVDAKLYNEDGAYTVVVNYPERMDLEGKYAVNDLDRYTAVYDSDDDVSFADLEDVTLDVVDNGATVEITIPQDENPNFSLDADNSLEIGRVADASGNAISAYSFEKDLDGEGEVGYSAKATAVDTVELAFDDRVDFEVNDFTFYDQSDNVRTPSEVSTKIEDGKTVATIEFEDNFDSNVDADDGSGAYVEVPTDADDGDSLADSENRYGEPVSGGKEYISDSISPELESYDDIRVAHTDDSNEYSVELTFTEDVEGNADALGNYLTVDGYDFVTGDLTDKTFSVSNVDNDDNAVTLTVYDEDDSEFDFDIDLEPNRFLTDDQGNKAEFSESVTVEVYED